MKKVQAYGEEDWKNTFKKNLEWKWLKIGVKMTKDQRKNDSCEKQRKFNIHIPKRMEIKGMEKY